MEELNEQLQSAKENFENHGNREEYKSEVNEIFASNNVEWQWPTWPVK